MSAELITAAIASTAAANGNAVVEVVKGGGFIATNVDKVVALAKAHPVAATAIGVAAAGLVAVGAYKAGQHFFGDKKKAEVKPKAAAAEPKAEQPKKEEAAAAS